MKFEVKTDARAVADMVAEAAAHDRAVLADLFARCADDPNLVPTSAQRLTLVLRRHEAEAELRELGLRNARIPPRVAACVDPDLARGLLLRRLDSADPGERLEAIAVLAELRQELFSEGTDWSSTLDERALSACDEALASRTRESRVAAVRLLAIVRPKDVAARLRPFLDDPDLRDVVLDVLLRSPDDADLLDRSIARLDGGEDPRTSRDMEIVRRFALLSPRADLVDRAKETLVRRASALHPADSEDVPAGLIEELDSARAFVRQVREAGRIREDEGEAILDRCVSEICRHGLFPDLPEAHARVAMGLGYRRPKRESTDPLDDLSRVVRISRGSFRPEALIYEPRPHGLSVLRMVTGSRLYLARWVSEEASDRLTNLLSVLNAALARSGADGRFLVEWIDMDEDIVAFSDPTAFVGDGWDWDREADCMIEPVVESRELEPTGEELRSDLARLFDKGTEGLTTRELMDKLDDEGRTTLHLAARRDHPNLVGKLLRSGFDVDVRDWRGRTPMHHAVRSSTGSTIVELFEAGAAVDVRDEEGATPLHRAAEDSHDVHSIGALLDLGADIESRVDKPKPAGPRSTPTRVPTALELAAGYIFQFDTAENGQTPLHRAAAFGRLANLRYLIDHGANVDARDSLDQTPLHLAYARNQSECVEELLRRGADADAFDSQRRIPEERRLESDRRLRKAKSRVFLVYVIVGLLKAIFWLVLLPVRFVRLPARLVRWIRP